MDGGLPRVPAGGGGANQPPMTVEAYLRFADELLDARRFAALRVGPPGVESYRRGNDWNNYQLGFWRGRWRHVTRRSLEFPLYGLVDLNWAREEQEHQ